MDSKYWFAKKTEAEKKKKRISKVLSELSTICGKVSDVPETLDQSEQYFRDGGYFDGDTLDRGILRACSSDLETALSTLSTTISTYGEIVKELEEDIKTYNTNYLSCLEQEKKEG